MREVIIYQLKNRKNTILFLLAVFGVLNLIAWALEAIKIMNGDFLRIANTGFWIPLAIMAQTVTTIVMFFTCSSGHAKSLLYKDTSYLWLTVPRRGWEILGGRFIAGAIEFAAYAIPVAFFMSVHAAMGGWASGNYGFFESLAYMYRQVFVVNAPALLQITLLAAFAFVTTGFILTFAIVASRSLVKNRGAATALTITLFVLVSNWTMKLGSFVSDRFGWIMPIRLSIESPMIMGKFDGSVTINGSPVTNSIDVPVAAVLLMCVLAAALFAVASWLMEEKVEV